VQLVLTRDPDEFAERAKPVLEGPIEGNLLATVLMTVRDRSDPGALFAYGVEDGGIMRSAALRTPPWPLLTSAWPADGISELVRRWLEDDFEVSGVSGPPDTARAIADAWAAQTGGVTSCRMAQAMHVLDEVQDPPHPAPGSLRVAKPDERPLLVAWMRDFTHDVGLAGSDQAEAMVDVRLSYGGLLVWDAGGAASILGVTPPVAGVVRIGPVYTPPDKRRRGYAASAVAAASRQALADGARACMLFTDLANPTSNRIYAEVGYRRTGDWELHGFERASQPEG
jgi:predicted GNAT family acetyltransferase